MSNYIILNDLSLRGNGHLYEESNWQKVVQFKKVFDKLSTMGFKRLIVPDKINNLTCCNFLLGDSYITHTNQYLSSEHRHFLSTILNRVKTVSNLEQLIELPYSFRLKGAESMCLARCVQEKRPCISFAFLKFFSSESIDGDYVEGSLSRKETILNLSDIQQISLQSYPWLLSKWGCRSLKPLEQPMWNKEEARNFLDRHTDELKRAKEHPSEKIRILSSISTIVAEINGWVKDDYLTELNNSSEHRRIIFSSKFFSETDCYLSIDFEKPDVFFELINNQGLHQKQIKWDGTFDSKDKGSPDHDIYLSLQEKKSGGKPQRRKHY